MTDFKVEDFEGSGQYLIYDREYDPERKSYISTLVYKVGWKMNPDRRVTMISMADGWTKEGYIEEEGENAKFVPWETKEQFVDWLNNRKGMQSYRWANEEEVLIACTYNQNRIKGDSIIELDDPQECDLCGELTDSLSGNPSKWSIEILGGEQEDKYYHYGCLRKMITKHKRDERWTKTN